MTFCSTNADMVRNSAHTAKYPFTLSDSSSVYTPINMATNAPIKDAHAIKVNAVVFRFR
ncbi:hypothetical protein D3C84_1286870 [compost metagenome]